MYYNNGTFETENEETMKELLRIIDEVGLGTATCSESDLYRLDDKFCLELTDCIGDIEISLKEIVDACEKADLKISFYITYCGMLKERIPIGMESTKRLMKKNSICIM